MGCRAAPTPHGTLRGIDWRMYCCQYTRMTRTRRVTANLPADLLKEATEVTGKGITDTLVEGLELVRRRRVLHKATALKGKLALKIDLATSRERARR